MSSLATVALATPATARAAEVTAVAQDGLDARHSLGFQVGGSAVIQAIYRLRLVGHSYFELGGGGVPEGFLNASAGLVLAHPTGTRFFPYAAAGVGAAGGAGYAGDKNAAGASCTSGVPGCSWSSRSAEFFYVRAGVGMFLERVRHLSFDLDVGTWIGESFHATDDGLGGKTSSTKKIVWPMVGLACLYSF